MFLSLKRTVSHSLNGQLTLLPFIYTKKCLRAGAKHPIKSYAHIYH